MDTVFNSGDTWDSIGILGQVWYLIVNIPDHCILTFYEHKIKCWSIRIFSFRMN